ncbi:MAG: family helicase [Planctomycetaceae bacterium]|nr:family helicase [Planctomycetaceae bacterium]
MSELNLEGIYRKLSPLSQQLLQILALSHKEVDLSTLTIAIRECGWGTAATKSGTLTQAIVKSELTEMSVRNLVNIKDSRLNQVLIAPSAQDFGVQQAIRSNNFQLITNSLNKLNSQMQSNLGGWRSQEQLLLDARHRARIAFYRGDVTDFTAAKQKLTEFAPQQSDLGLLSPFDADLFERTPDALKPEVLVNAVHQAIQTAKGSPTALELFDPFAFSQAKLSEAMRDAWVQLHAARGDLNGLRKMADANQPHSKLAAGCLAFLTADYDPAETAFSEVTSQLRKTTGKRNAVLAPLPGLMQMLLLLRKNDPKSRSALKTLCEGARV